MDQKTKLLLADGSVVERFVMEGGKQRELVVVMHKKVEGNPHGCVLMYRDQMTDEHKEMSHNDMKALVEAKKGGTVKKEEKKERDDDQATAGDRDWSQSSKSDISEELTRLGIKHDPKDKKETLLGLLPTK